MVHTTGKASAFQINAGPILHGKGWDVANAGTEVRTDSTKDNGYSDREVAMKDAVVTMEMDFDVEDNLMTGTPTLQPGTVLTNLKLYIDAVTADSPHWLFPKAIVITAPMSSKVGEATKWTVTIGNKGAFTPPTGEVTPSAFGAAYPAEV